MKTFCLLAVLCAVQYSYGTEDAAQPKNLDPVAADSTDLMDSTNKAKREYPPISVCQCPMIHAPSCGADGNIYPNPCVRECEGVEGASIDTCITPYRRSGRPCGCTKEYYPVCGSDRKIYSNYCLLRCAGARPMGQSFCNKVDSIPYRRSGSGRPCRCTKEYDPVCGGNGVMYSNPCRLRCAGVWPGPASMCRNITPYRRSGSPCMCPTIYAPVYGIRCRKYNNLCLLECAGDFQSPDSRCEGVAW